MVRMMITVHTFFTIKADAFTVIFVCAKSSPLARQPDFMHMYHESAFIHSGEACRMGIYSESLTVSAAPNYPSHRSTRDCPASVSLVLVHALLSGEKASFSACFLTYMALSASSKTLRREK